ncbi:hypothetical protein [Nakamurella endophytica]|uniref:hypothetical protein n=1 Tax=Nakamurella endophytica TaxID=1748367 RepID=UPI001E5538A4|nr:hypothetical protein [Nakamurella endophytica]
MPIEEDISIEEDGALEDAALEDGAVAVIDMAALEKVEPLEAPAVVVSLPPQAAKLRVAAAARPMRPRRAEDPFREDMWVCSYEEDPDEGVLESAVPWGTTSAAL